MDDASLIARWKQEEAQPFQGWDFSYLAGRRSEEQPPWSYEHMVSDLLAGADAVLDMGTGGGEKLLEFRDVLPANTVATEGYPPNVPVARANLEPHGIRVVDYNLEVTPRMPFEDNNFALIINRHEAFDAQEVARILRPGGIFLTQQVDGRELGDFLTHFGQQSAFLHVNVRNCQQGLADAGLEIVHSEEWAGKSTFQDVGALVYFLHAAPWSARNFHDALAAGYSALVAEREGRIVAFGVIVLAPGEAQLLNLSVVPDARREGLGGELLRRFLVEAVRLGAEQIFLEVRVSNAPAIALYERERFVGVGRRTAYYPPGRDGTREDALVMRRSLSAADLEA